ncbi:hypothetical protein AAFF_G00009280 [Aldrovandia affinis]|uniref:Uncharacterized protein n=1 Tax=Aldrovandia affinis TaxID=143900 RepID=A0AAD7WZY7_9TELE|nr:hypothetical protein AAFF_G00009280 [Aldrovandia affinis]
MPCTYVFAVRIFKDTDSSASFNADSDWDNWLQECPPPAPQTNTANTMWSSKGAGKKMEELVRKMMALHTAQQQSSLAVIEALQRNMESQERRAYQETSSSDYARSLK